MKLKKRDLMRLNNAITAIEGRKFSVKFSYFLAKNKIQLKDEISMLDQLRMPSDEFKEYDSERAKLALKYADRNPDGSPKIDNQEFLITIQAGKFQEGVSKLKEKYNEVIEQHNQQLKEFEEILDEEAIYDGATVGYKDIPDDIEPVIIEVLLSAALINEEEK
jgi:outer membrane protein OmpA-like peptidoglycan-associated protein